MKKLAAALITLTAIGVAVKVVEKVNITILDLQSQVDSKPDLREMNRLENKIDVINSNLNKLENYKTR